MNKNQKNQLARLKGRTNNVYRELKQTCQTTADHYLRDQAHPHEWSMSAPWFPTCTDCSQNLGTNYLYTTTTIREKKLNEMYKVDFNLCWASHATVNVVEWNKLVCSARVLNLRLQPKSCTVRKTARFSCCAKSPFKYQIEKVATVKHIFIFKCTDMNLWSRAA